MIPGGSFWSSWRSSQSIENLLSQSDLTLEDLLDEEDVIQEVRNQNTKLLAYFDHDKLLQLLVYVTEEPTNLSNIKSCHKFPFVACEIFSCEVSAIMEKLVEERDLLDKLFSVVKSERLHPTLAGYFSKVFISLFKTFEEAVLKELESGQWLKDFLRHLYSRSIADVVAKVVALDDRPYHFYVPMRTEAVIEVVRKIEPGQSYETVSNAVYILVDLIQRSKEVNAWSELVKAVGQRDVLQGLFDQLSCSDVHVVKSAVVVLSAICNSEILSLYKGSEQDEDSTLMNDEDDLPPLIELFISKIGDLSLILKQESTTMQRSTLGVQVKFLGEGRLKLIELVTAVLKLDNSALLAAIARSDLLEVITGLFREYSWNSLLHGAYEQLVGVIIQTNSTDLKESLLAKANLPLVLIGLGSQNETKYGNGVALRTGQAGYVTRIGNILDNASKIQDYVRGILNATPQWRDFSEGVVATQNEIETRNLGGKQPNSSFRSVTSEEEDLIDIKPERFSSWKYAPQQVEPNTELEEEIEDTKGEMTTEELDNDAAFEFKPVEIDFGVSARFDATSFKIQNSSEFNSNNYWKIELKIDDLEDLD